MNFEKQVIVVSGASSGIGRSCAEAMLNLNATVIGLDINASSINHEKYVHYVVDVTSEADIVQTIERVEEQCGHIDGLANCVGIFSNGKPFYDLDIDEWNKVIETNLTSVFLLSKYVSRKMMINRSGKIINISCIRSKVFKPNMAEYAASKGGVTALTSAMALDLAPFNITVNGIAPGYTYTGMTAKAFEQEDIKRQSESIIPMGRIARPDDISGVAAFLFSEWSDYMTGETMIVDGGLTVSK